MRRTAVVACLFALPASLLSQALPLQNPDKTFQAAMAAEDRGDLNRAERLLLELRSGHPGVFAIDESLGLLYGKQGRIDAALPLLRAAASEQPDSDSAHANLGAAYYQLHRNQEALAEFKAAARLNPLNADTQQSLGRLLMEEHLPAAAAEAFSTSIKLAPQNHDLVLDRAQALIQAGQPAQAATELEAMADVDRSAAAQSLLGDAEEKTGAYQKAAEHYARAAELDPSEQNAWIVGVEFLRHWTFDAAIKEFHAATWKFPKSIRIRLGLGAAYFGASQYAESIPVFADLLNSDPNNPLFAELLGMACTTNAQSHKDQCSALIRYAESHPKNAKASTYAASVLLTNATASDHSPEARRLLSNALAVEPRSAEALYQLGLLKQNQGDWTGSVSSLEKAVGLKPDLAPAHYRLALAYWRTGRKQDGQTQMELQKKYAKQQKEDVDHRLKQITTFIVDVRD